MSCKRLISAAIGYHPRWVQVTKGLPIVAGSLCLFAGGGLTWLVATSSWFYSCRLSVETDLYSCWSALAFPLAAGISSAAIGSMMILRGMSNFPWPLKVRHLISWKALFLVGSLLLCAVWIITLQFVVRIASLGLAIGTFLSLVGSATLVLLSFEWIRSYLNPNKAFLTDSEEINEEDVN